MGTAGIEQVSSLDSDQVAAALALAERVAGDEGVRPVSEQALLQLRYGDAIDTDYLLLHSGEDLTGFAVLHRGDAGASAELAAVDRDGARALVEALTEGAPSRLRIWAHGESSRAAAVMHDLDLHPERVLLQLRRPLSGELPEPVVPDDVSIRSFVVGQDEAAWLDVNNAAFADHPEQSGWTLAEITHREHEPWFDPAGFFLAERDGELLGFHWTKVHPTRPPSARDAGGPIGEVYVVGVAPAAQGLRLGKALTLVGLAHLQSLGMPDVMLYADESNTTAVAMYERLGFTRWDADTMFTLG